MQPNTQHRTHGAQPVVRNACEPCHQRKTRCIISTDGGPCDSCESRGLSCYFLPRARSGRPPITNSALKKNISSRSTNRNSSDNQFPLPQTPDSEIQNDHFNWDWTLATNGLDERSQSTELLDLDRPLSNARTAGNFGLHPSVVERAFSDLSKVQDQNLCLASPSSSLRTQLPDITNFTYPSPPSNPDGKTGTKLGEREFSTFLQLCTKLQEHVALADEMTSSSVANVSTITPLMTPTIPVARRQEILGDIDRSCNVILSVYGQGILSKPTAHLIEDLDHASISLAIALIFKIFQVCDAVLSCNLFNSQGPNDLLLHKRLDFNLTQATIVMSKIEELTQGGLAVLKNAALHASYIDNKFRTIS